MGPLHGHRFRERRRAELRAADGTPQGETVERKKVQESPGRRSHDLSKRTEEPDCPFNIATLEKQRIPQNQLPQRTADLIALALYNPRMACARILLEDRQFRSGRFRETFWKHACETPGHGSHVGAVEAHCFGR
jgi:hypothetical protein